MWQASMSKRDMRMRLVPAPTWSERFRDGAIDRLRTVLGPAGEPSRERVVLMVASLSLYRATTEAEAALLPASFWAEPPVDLFGGAVAILSETEEGPLSTRPCHDPGRKPMGLDGRLWLPVDCGTYPPCVARKEIEGRHD